MNRPLMDYLFSSFSLPWVLDALGKYDDNPNKLCRVLGQRARLMRLRKVNRDVVRRRYAASRIAQ